MTHKQQQSSLDNEKKIIGNIDMNEIDHPNDASNKTSLWFCGGGGQCLESFVFVVVSVPLVVVIVE